MTKELQKRIVENKRAKGFNTTNIPQEFCHLHAEASEAFEAYLKDKDDLGEELADIAIYTLGLAELLGYDLGEEIEKKVDKNEKRVYEKQGHGHTRVKEGE